MGGPDFFSFRWGHPQVKGSGYDLVELFMATQSPAERPEKEKGTANWRDSRHNFPSDHNLYKKEAWHRVHIT